MKINIVIFFLFAATYSIGQMNKQTVQDTFVYFSIIDSTYNLYELPKKINKPKKWINADEERSSSMGDFYGNSYSDTFDLNDALKIIDNSIMLSEIGSAKSWCINNYQIAFPFLIARLSDKRKIGLGFSADLIIVDRIRTGELEFYGHGAEITEDIFTIAGRASWILNQLTGEIFAEVHIDLTISDSEKFKKMWLEYIQKLN